MEYNILHARNQEKLIALVNEAIFLGWYPLGAVVVAVFGDANDKREYNQTMIKGEESA